MGKLTIALGIFALAGCGFDEGHMRGKYSGMSDQQLMREWARANLGMMPEISPQDDWIFEEMQKRRLIGDSQNPER